MMSTGQEPLRTEQELLAQGQVREPGTGWQEQDPTCFQQVHQSYCRSPG